jgi:WXG100 family type VII secretion target
MGTDGEILVRSTTLESGASDVDAIAARIEQQLGDLGGVVRPLAAAWTGEAATEYQSLQARWDTSAEGLHEVLLQIARVLRIASEAYAEGERTNAAMFGG